MDYREIILKEFDILRSIASLEAGGHFKEKAYEAAIKVVSSLPPLYSPEDLPPPSKGDGLSKDLRAKIAYIFLNGELNISPEARRAAGALKAFQGIYGVGPKAAQKFLEAGYTTIEQLRAVAVTKPKLLNRNQQAGLLYYEDLQERIPRVEMEQHAALLMRLKPVALEGIIVGSYRRGRPDSGDIDMLIRTARADVDAGDALNDYVKRLQDAGYLEVVLAHGAHKCLSIVRYEGGVARRLDLLVTPPEEFPFAVFYFTGCDTFNVAVRGHAQKMGFTLNEHALTHVKSGLKVEGLKTEEAIFAALKLRFIPPTERTGADKVIRLV